MQHFFWAKLKFRRQMEGFEHGINWCAKCKMQVNFKSKAVAVAHYRSKRHASAIDQTYIANEEEQYILQMTKDEAQAIVRPVAEKEYVPMQLVVIDNQGKVHKVYSSVENGIVK